MTTAARPAVARTAAWAVTGYSVVFSLVQFATIVIDTAATETIVAALAIAVFLPLHVRHLRSGLRGERPPHAGISLAGCVAAQAVALVVVGSSWTLMLGLLALSAMIVLRPPWAWVALAACALAPAFVSLDADAVLFTRDQAFNLGAIVVLYGAVLFSLVWLVAAVHQYAVTQTALAADAAAQERESVAAGLRESLERNLDAVTDAAVQARERPDSATLGRTRAASQRALSDLRSIVAGAGETIGRSAAAALVRAARDGATPVGAALVLRRARVAAVLVYATVLVFLLLISSGRFGAYDEVRPLLATVVWVGMAGLMVSFGLETARDRRLPAQRWRWLALSVLHWGTLPMLGGMALGGAWCVVAATLVTFRGWVAGGLLAVALVASGIVDVVAFDLFASSVAYGVVSVVSFPLIALIIGTGLYAAARLVAVVGDLDAARDALAHRAAVATRHRLSRDLHDVLGQRLTAISVKAELALALLDSDPARAETEVREVAVLALRQRDEVAGVARGEREVALAVETEEAVALLRAAGVAVEVELAPELDERASTLLAWAVREGTTNVLRHARARRATLRVTHDGGGTRLELVNDGADVRTPDGAGTGLAGLGERFAGAGGSARGERLAGGRFRLLAELPM